MQNIVNIETNCILNKISKTKISTWSQNWPKEGYENNFNGSKLHKMIEI